MAPFATEPSNVYICFLPACKFLKVVPNPEVFTTAPVEKTEQLRNEGNLSGPRLHHDVCEVHCGAPPLSLAALRGFIELYGPYLNCISA